MHKAFNDRDCFIIIFCYFSNIYVDFLLVRKGLHVAIVELRQILTYRYESYKRNLKCMRIW